MQVRHVIAMQIRHVIAMQVRQVIAMQVRPVIAMQVRPHCARRTSVRVCYLLRGPASSPESRVLVDRLRWASSACTGVPPLSSITWFWPASWSCISELATAPECWCRAFLRNIRRRPRNGWNRLFLLHGSVEQDVNHISQVMQRWYVIWRRQGFA